MIKTKIATKTEIFLNRNKMNYKKLSINNRINFQMNLNIIKKVNY